MIKTKSITKSEEADQIKIKGVEIVRVTSDGSYDKLRSIVLRDANGTEIEISGADCSNRIEVHIPRPPKIIKKWAIVGELDGLHIDQNFDKERDAIQSLENITLSLRAEVTHSLKIEEREIED